MNAASNLINVLRYHAARQFHCAALHEYAPAGIIIMVFRRYIMVARNCAARHGHCAAEIHKYAAAVLRAVAGNGAAGHVECGSIAHNIDAAADITAVPRRIVIIIGVCSYAARDDAARNSAPAFLAGRRIGGVPGVCAVVKQILAALVRGCSGIVRGKIIIVRAV